MATSHTHSGPETRGAVIHWASHYDQVVNLLTLGRRKRLRSMTIALARIQPGERVLEVGCGTGDLAIAACALVGPQGSVAGIDAGAEMIAVARAKAAQAGVAVDFRLEPIEALSYPEATFDVVLSSLMMHHLPDDLKRQGLAEIARVLKPGGRLLIVDAERPHSHIGQGLNRLMLHGKLSTGTQDLAPLFSAAGFVEIQTGSTDFAALGFGRLGYVRGLIPT